MASVTAPDRPSPKRRSGTRLIDREAFWGFVFIAPWLVGFLAFSAYPFLASFGLSFMKWEPVRDSSFVGLRNYQFMLSSDALFYKSLLNTAYYTVVHVPLNILIAMVTALMLNERIKGQALFRTIYYIPSVTSGVATALLWVWLFNSDYGIINAFLENLGMEPIPWLSSSGWAMPALILTAAWAFGSSMVICLAGLQSVPQHLYEAASVDGANSWHRFRHVTLPMMSPTLFFLTIVGVIGSFQVFTSAFIMTGGGPGYATLFYVLHLYYKSFTDLNFGYGSALAWALFLIIMIFTLFQFWAGRRWVYYEGGQAT